MFPFTSGQGHNSATDVPCSPFVFPGTHKQVLCYAKEVLSDGIAWYQSILRSWSHHIKLMKQAKLNDHKCKSLLSTILSSPQHSMEIEQ